MVNVRLKAYELFKAIVRDGGYSNIVIANGLEDNIYVTDRGFITALVYGTIDKLYNIDYIISLFAKGRIQPRVQDVLRLSVYQIMYMDIADYTVCNEAVKLVAILGKGALKGYVNGVLRNILRNKDKIEYPDKQNDFALYLSLKYSWPQFIVQEFIDDIGKEETEALLSHQSSYNISVCANNLKITDKELFDELTNKKYEPEVANFYKNVFHITGNRIFKDDLFTKGKCNIISEPSVMISEVLAPQHNERILDCCAAPGGKSLYMAQLMKKGSIVACDIHEHRCELIKANAARCGAEEIIDVKQCDASAFSEELGLFDRVLVDAPCSGLGVAHTKPDIKLKTTPESLAEIETIQANILENCSKYVKNGGILVYSTCTMRQKENSRIVKDFLLKHSEFKVEQLALPDRMKCLIDSNGFVQFWPHIHGVGGFFAAKLIKL